MLEAASPVGEYRKITEEIVLDVFGSSGSTLIAAASCGRRARLIEYDPLYCDAIVRRWQTYTGKEAHLEAGNKTFAELADQRLVQRPAKAVRATRRIKP